MLNIDARKNSQTLRDRHRVRGERMRERERGKEYKRFGVRDRETKNKGYRERDRMRETKRE